MYARCLPLSAAFAIFAYGAFGASDTLDGTYAGERVLTKGYPAECTAQDPVSVTN